MTYIPAPRLWLAVALSLLGAGCRLGTEPAPGHCYYWGTTANGAEVWYCTGDAAKHCVDHETCSKYATPTPDSED